MLMWTAPPGMAWTRWVLRQRADHMEGPEHAWAARGDTCISRPLPLLPGSLHLAPCTFPLCVASEPRSLQEALGPHPPTPTSAGLPRALWGMCHSPPYSKRSYNRARSRSSMRI